MAEKNKNRTIINYDAAIGTIFVFFMIFVFSIIFSANIFTPLKRVFEDFSITNLNAILRNEELIPADTNIVLINSCKLNNYDLLDLIDKLSSYNPSVIGIEDIDCLSLDNDSIKKLDSILLKAKVVIGYELFNFDKNFSLSLSDTNKSIFFDKYKNLLAYNDIDFQKDRRFFTQRECYPLIKTDTGFLKSFPLKLVELYDPEKNIERLKKNADKEIINFKGNFNKFFFYEGWDLVNDKDPVNRFTNKIILIGNCPVFDEAKNLNELFFTPLNTNYSGRTFPDMFRTVILANIINMIIEENYYNSMPDILIIVITFLITYFNFLLFLLVTNYKKELYELASIMAFLIQSTLILVLTYFFYYTFRFDLKLTLSLIAIATTIFIFEAYVDSVKPFFLFILKKGKDSLKQKNNNI